MPSKHNRPEEPGYELDQGGFIGKTPESRKKALKRAKSLGQARREMEKAHAKGKGPKYAIKDHQTRVRKGVAYS